MMKKTKFKCCLGEKFATRYSLLNTHCNNGYAKASQHYVLQTLHIMLYYVQNIV